MKRPPNELLWPRQSGDALHREFQLQGLDPLPVVFMDGENIIIRFRNKKARDLFEHNRVLNAMRR